MHIFLYTCAILCAIIGVLFAFPLVIVAIFIAGLGAIVSNTKPQAPTAGYQPTTGDAAPDNPPNEGGAGRRVTNPYYYRGGGTMSAVMLLAVMLGACSTPMTLAPMPISMADQDAVKITVKEQLRDPESAQFTKIAAGRDDKGRMIVCGAVNSKNGFGGYNGPAPFYGVLSGRTYTVIMLADAQHHGMKQMVQDACGSVGTYYRNPFFG
jgi:hypothetical protein